MSNPLFNLLGGGQQQLPSIPGLGNIGGLLNQFNQFRQGFHGDPHQQIQQMLSSGQVSQDQVNQAIQVANVLKNFIH